MLMKKTLTSRVRGLQCKLRTELFFTSELIAEEEPIMFRSYSKTSGYFLRDNVAKAMVIMISSRVKISCYLHV